MYESDGGWKYGRRVEFWKKNVDVLKFDESSSNLRLRNHSYRSPFNISLPPTIKRKPQNILSSMEKEKKKRKKKLPWIDTRWLSTVNYGQLIEGKPIFRWTSNQGTIVGRLDTFYQWLITEDRLNFSFSCVSFFVDTSVRYIFLRNRYGKYEKLMGVGKISETFYDSIIKRRKKEKQWRNRLI